MHQLLAWLNILTDIFQGVEGMLGLITADFGQYPTNLRIFEDSKGGKFTIEAANEHQARSIVKARHGFAHVVAFSIGQRAASSVANLEELDFLSRAANDSEIVDIQVTLEWFVDSPALTLCNNMWEEKRAELVAALVAELDIGNTSTMDASRAEEAVVDKNFLPLLIGGDLRQLALKATHEDDAATSSVGGKQSKTIPDHLRRSMLARALFTEVSIAPTATLASLQNVSEDTQVMTTGHLCILLGVYTWVHSAMITASALHMSLFVNDDAGVASKQESDQGTTMASGIQCGGGRVVRLINSLKAELKQLVPRVTSLDIYDKQGYQLKKSMSHCRSWVRQLEFFLKGCQLCHVGNWSTALKADAEELEGIIPRWEVVFEHGELNTALARERILSHPKRSRISPLTKGLTKQVKEWESCLRSWGLDDAIEDCTKSFLRSTVLMGNNFLIIAAGLNTVLNMRQLRQGAAQAQEVLDFISKSSQYYAANKCGTLNIPDVLASILNDMAENVPERSQDPRLKRTIGDDVEGSQKKKPRGDAENPQVGGAGGSTGSASSSNNKVVKQEAPEADDEGVGVGRHVAKAKAATAKAKPDPTGKGLATRSRKPRVT